MNTQDSPRNVVQVWDRTTRWFHAVNLACVLLLVALGVAILNAATLGVSDQGKVLLKTWHVYVGYLFSVNLLWRLVWGFVGGRYARWRLLLPFGRGYRRELRDYVRGLLRKQPPSYAGHDPLGRLMVSMLLLLMLAQAITGLVLAGTDLYKPPFGNAIAAWVTGGDPEKLANLEPGSKAFVDPAAYDEMRAFRQPFVTVHEFVFYALLGAVVLHLLGVVVTELVERNGLLSSLVSGQKALAKPPVDGDGIDEAASGASGAR